MAISFFDPYHLTFLSNLAVRLNTTVHTMAHDRVTNIQTATGVFLAVIWITACMRVYVKRFMSNSYALEDWLSMVGTVLLLLQNYLMSTDTSIGVFQYHGSLLHWRDDIYQGP